MRCSEVLKSFKFKRVSRRKQAALLVIGAGTPAADFTFASAQIVTAHAKLKTSSTTKLNHSTRDSTQATYYNYEKRSSPVDKDFKMPAIRTAKNRKPPPDGFEDIEDTLLEFENKMKDAQSASHEGKKKHEMLWPVFQITHQRMYAP